MIIAFNIREMYLYRRINKFKGSRITRKSVNRKYRDDLLLEDIRKILYVEDG